MKTIPPEGRVCGLLSGGDSRMWRMVGAIVSISNEGFLGSGAPFSADINLVVQVTMGGALIAGIWLAKKRC
jgi:hypothetical protein